MMTRYADRSLRTIRCEIDESLYVAQNLCDVNMTNHSVPGKTTLEFNNLVVITYGFEKVGLN